MKLLSPALILLGLYVAAHAQESTPKWEVGLPQPITDGTASEPKPQAESVEFAVLSSRTTRIEVTKAAETSELPPIQGTINVTVQMVADPKLTDPPPPLPALSPDDPAVIARLEELRANYRGSELLFLSATVYDKHRTLLRIYPNGKIDKMVTAWSNLNFNHFSGFSCYRVKEADGRFLDIGLLMGIGNMNTSRMAQGAPAIAELPDLVTAGPAFQVVEGDAESPAMDTLEQIHELYRKEGEKMETAYHARERARAERKAFLLANPPRPEDVTIRFWNRERPQQPQIEEGTR
ncbi:hypothetical protein OJ996_13995 [Luteolibacter sp. GHJ8]|uniref:Uncharacterized protein n=1 Tax=Luteolibacter rhizosphaerae TaxID=2989719 RepID=A0ABT3G4B5_9BACT|nr:hypothetical protein [Luteolibacter rhizosphaerae]MCW1914695.1 hypothetical protein [Luteolibacter rhizosphaerae]